MPLDPTGGALMDFSSTLGGSGTLGSLGGAGAASGLNPVLMAATIGLTLLSGLLGKSEQQKKKRDVAMMEPYLQKFYMPSRQKVSGLNDAVLQAIMANMGRSENWGWPTTANPNSDVITKLLGA